MRNIVSKRNTLLLIIIVCSIICTVSIGKWLVNDTPMGVALSLGSRKQASQPLLLASGWAQSATAQIKIMIWFDNGEIPDTINSVLPISQWQWHEEIFRGPEYGKKTIVLIAAKEIDKAEEETIRIGYPAWVNQVKSAGGHIYIDERIPEEMNIAAYIRAAGATAKQCFSSERLQSIAALNESWGNDVMAGHDRINFQILTQKTMEGGQTVLAVPALLEEF